MKKVAAIGDAVFNHHAFGIAFDERRGGTTYLIGQKEGRLFMAQVGDRQLANGTVIVFEMDCFVQNPRSAVRSRDVVHIDSSPCCALSDILATSPDNFANNRIMMAIEYRRRDFYAFEFYRIWSIYSYIN